MGMPSLPELLVIAAILMLLFGTKRIRTLGQDMGQAIKGFRIGFKELEETKETLLEDERERISDRSSY